jgi:UDP-GlcNAc3NAcA epimerase
MAEMNFPKRVMIVIGARPQFIKAAALHRALKNASGWEATWVHTGQHHDEALSTQFFQELELPEPQIRLSPRSDSRELRLGDMMNGIRVAIQEARPDWLLVFGDTDSTLAGAWAATAEEIPLIHVEAGLRSHRWSMPEEINRVLTDRMSSLLVCPTDAAVAHLEREGISHTSSTSPHPKQPWVLRTGDVMHDNALHYGAAWPESGRGQGRMLLTMHRPSNVDHPARLQAWLGAIGTWLEQVGREATFPVHPRTARVLDAHQPTWREVLRRQHIFCTPPAGYVALLEAVCAAPLVLTDSGGVQKEAYSMGTRCLVLRDTTEWVEQVERGHSVLVSEPGELSHLADKMLGLGRFDTDDLYGNGHAAEDILRCMDEA